MSLVKCTTSICLIFILQQGLAETYDASQANTDEELDEEFLEVLGSVEANGDEWFEIFLSIIDEAEIDEEITVDAEYE